MITLTNYTQDKQVLWSISDYAFQASSQNNGEPDQ